MVDTARWIASHVSEIHRLAELSGTEGDTARFVVALILEGLTDDEVYGRLRKRSPSRDGRRRPVGAWAVQLVTHARQVTDMY